MAEVLLKAEPGRPTGTRPSKRLRADGAVPAVVYGPGVEPFPVVVQARDLRAALSTEAGLNALLSLQVDGKPYLTMARELQRHPVRGTVVHVDFQVVDPNREVSAEVPILLSGDAVDLHRADGVLDQQLFSFSVRARPADIPTHIEVDISELVIGSAIRVSEVILPPGVTTDLDPESVIVAGQAPRVQVEEVPEAEAAEGQAPGAEAAAAAPAAAATGEGASGSAGGGGSEES